MKKCDICNQEKETCEIALLDGFAFKNGEKVSRIDVCKTCEKKVSDKFKMRRVEDL